MSAIHAEANGRTAEIGIVGNDGFIGIGIIMGDKSTPRRAVVQGAGHAYRLRAKYLKEEFTRGVALQHLVMRYTQSLFAQISQTAVCNRHHNVEQQSCRWLLLWIDRLPSDVLAMTQELIANMLGVRREGVTEAANKLKKLGLISYGRRRIVVLDRPALEAHVCERSTETNIGPMRGAEPILLHRLRIVRTTRPFNTVALMFV